VPCPERPRSAVSPPASLAARALVVAAISLAVAAPAHAYIGPGAGFALLSSFLVAFVTFLAAIVSLLLWPFRAVWRLVRRRRLARPWVRRLVVVGFDGQDVRLTEKMLAKGQLPNLARLAATGTFKPLATTFPSVSPVAWSSFATGVHPAKHNIFDFLTRDLRTYLPVLSSTDFDMSERVLKVGKYRIPLRRPTVRLLRKSRTFWSILGEHGVWSTILRVPITFPPERFRGALLSAMCVPDLLGTQGTFMLFSTRSGGEKFQEGGIRVALAGSGDRYESTIRGPENSFREGKPPLEIPLVVETGGGAGRARVTVSGQTLDLAVGALSEWVTLRFPVVPGITVSGICRMMLTEVGEHVSLYVSPLNIDPERPAMPISHPSYYAPYLAKKIGPYATLGLAEDTWGLNERILDDDAFLKLTCDIDAEREAMMFAALDKLRDGVLVCVFDATDRVQHMFWRYAENGHPAARGAVRPKHADAIEEIYRRNDAIVGRVLAKLGPDDVLLVLSDHGFTSFRRGVNVNAWLLANGYLALKNGADGSGEWLADVDWTRTRAYALGLTGLFLNVRGRESGGIVAPGEEAERLKAELVAGLSGLRDPDSGEVAVREAFDPAKLYSGPYLGNAPDVIVGCNHGYRISWGSATGVVAGPICEDNPKAWSGDHCVDPRLVPGVLFSDRTIDADEPRLIDIAPTALRLFGVEPPAHMDGRALFASPDSLRPRAAPEPGRTPKRSRRKR
jgi:predicted AlkP superfamily phosphohydrolase/phosphomutase